MICTNNARDTPTVDTCCSFSVSPYARTHAAITTTNLRTRYRTLLGVLKCATRLTALLYGIIISLSHFIASSTHRSAWPCCRHHLVRAAAAAARASVTAEAPCSTRRGPTSRSLVRRRGAPRTAQRRNPHSCTDNPTCALARAASARRGPSTRQTTAGMAA